MHKTVFTTQKQSIKNHILASLILKNNLYSHIDTKPFYEIQKIYKCIYKMQLNNTWIYMQISS